MVQPWTLSKGLVVKKISYVCYTSSCSQKIDNTGALRHRAVRELNFMVDHPTEEKEWQPHLFPVDLLTAHQRLS